MSASIMGVLTFLNQQIFDLLAIIIAFDDGAAYCPIQRFLVVIEISDFVGNCRLFS